jgi:hypothetical protein
MPKNLGADEGGQHMRLTIPDTAGQELVDAIVAAVDVDRSFEVDRLRLALESFDLDESFADELRLSGVSSATWRLCHLCSDVVAGYETAQEVA